MKEIIKHKLLFIYIYFVAYFVIRLTFTRTPCTRPGYKIPTAATLCSSATAVCGHELFVNVPPESGVKDLGSPGMRLSTSLKFPGCLPLSETRRERTYDVIVGVVPVALWITYTSQFTPLCSFTNQFCFYRSIRTNTIFILNKG